MTGVQTCALPIFGYMYPLFGTDDPRASGLHTIKKNTLAICKYSSNSNPVPYWLACSTGGGFSEQIIDKNGNLYILYRHVDGSSNNYGYIRTAIRFGVK